MPFILEVQYFNIDIHKSKHIGYMNKLFKTKKEAKDYYDKFNPHMCSLNAHNNQCSVWDATTKLMYIVRERFYEYLKIPAFDE